jgi:hypothetical protein
MMFIAPVQMEGCFQILLFLVPRQVTAFPA